MRAISPRRRGILCVLLGLAAPPAAFLVTAKLVTPPPGVDGYVPAMLGGIVGLVLGTGLIVHGARWSGFGSPRHSGWSRREAGVGRLRPQAPKWQAVPVVGLVKMRPTSVPLCLALAAIVAAPACNRGPAGGQATQSDTSDATGSGTAGSSEVGGASSEATSTTQDEGTSTESSTETGVCTNDDECEAATPFCVEGQCVECRNDADCPFDLSVCDAGVCKDCLDADACPDRTFRHDIYPILVQQSCTACHVGGGPGSDAWDISGSAMSSYISTLSRGTTCLTLTPPDTDAGDNIICTDDPENSRLVTVPTGLDPGTPEGHPVGVWTEDNPTIQVIVQWVELGAPY